MCGVLRSPVPLWNSFHSCVWQWQCLPQSWGAKKGNMYIILGAPSNCGLSQSTEIPWSREALGTPCTLSLGCGPTVFFCLRRGRRYCGDGIPVTAVKHTISAAIFKPQVKKDSYFNFWATIHMNAHHFTSDGAKVLTLTQTIYTQMMINQINAP